MVDVILVVVIVVADCLQLDPWYMLPASSSVAVYLYTASAADLQHYLLDEVVAQLLSSQPMRCDDHVGLRSPSGSKQPSPNAKASTL